MNKIHFNGTLTPVKKAIEQMQKSISLRQIAIQANVNYITLRNILFEKQSRVTTKVEKRIANFYGEFDPKYMKEMAPRRGRKPLSSSPSISAPAKGYKNSQPVTKGTDIVALFDGLRHLDYDRLIQEKEAELTFLRNVRDLAKQGRKKSVPATA
jgi:lambda repressor-like predicted transcriptional regulator